MKKLLILGGAGFIGTNLAVFFSADSNNRVTVADEEERYFETIKQLSLPNTACRVSQFHKNTNFDDLLRGQDIVFHLASTSIPGTSNRVISEELDCNVVTTALMLDACVRQHVGKVVFLSSGGAVYGKEPIYPISENMELNPISSYGIQKIAIEKLLYLYQYQFGLDYRIIRLSNPYGPYQRPDGRLGVVSTFIYKVLTGQKLSIYGDGSIVRDFIYIDDAIKGIVNIMEDESGCRVFNLGSGKGVSVREVADIVQKVLSASVGVEYKESRKTDVPINYLDISRYEKTFGKQDFTPLEVGIKKTAEFMKMYYRLG